MIELQRSAGWSRGCWRPWVDPVWPGPVLKRTAAIVCPQCGRLFSLVKNHAVGQGGVVTPSVVCPYCPWHMNVRLVGWPC